jgi:hypothetical protein
LDKSWVNSCSKISGLTLRRPPPTGNPKLAGLLACTQVNVPPYFGFEESPVGVVACTGVEVALVVVADVGFGDDVVVAVGAQDNVINAARIERLTIDQTILLLICFPPCVADTLEWLSATFPGQMLGAFRFVLLILESRSP